MAKTIDITKQVKRAERRAKIKRGFESVLNWARENPQLAIGGATVLIGAGTALTKGVMRTRRIKVADKALQRRVWDPKEGTYWRLRRELTNEEKRYISRMVDNGESRGEVLSRLGVLK